MKPERRNMCTISFKPRTIYATGTSREGTSRTLRLLSVERVPPWRLDVVMSAANLRYLRSSRRRPGACPLGVRSRARVEVVAAPPGATRRSPSVLSPAGTHHLNRAAATRRDEAIISPRRCHPRRRCSAEPTITSVAPPPDRRAGGEGHRRSLSCRLSPRGRRTHGRP